MDPTEKARSVKNTYQDWLMSRPHVVGVGIGLRKIGGEPTGDVAVVVMVDQKLPASQLNPEDIIPHELDGVPVDVQEVGKLRAY
jgi:hypothetical protein